MQPIEDRVLAVVNALPPGRVATYGQVAAWAGLPRQARRVGRVLSALPAATAVPWHRVVAAGGRFALPPGSPSDREQRRRLAAEGLVIRGNRVALAAAAPDLDTLLWAPVLAGDAADDAPPAPVRRGRRRPKAPRAPGSARR
jgi:methylated-DNA-protein-cysteine methyltransferase-like protein